MEIGDTIKCADVELENLVHSLHKDGWELMVHQIGGRRFSIELRGKHDTGRKKVVLDDEE